MNSVTSYTCWMNRLLIERINFILKSLSTTMTIIDIDAICCIIITNQLIVELKFYSESQVRQYSIGEVI
jgi:hypothetical protein